MGTGIGEKIKAFIAAGFAIILFLGVVQIPKLINDTYPHLINDLQEFYKTKAVSGTELN